MLNVGHFLHSQSKRMSRKNLYDFLSKSLSCPPPPPTHTSSPDKRVLNIGSGGRVGEIVNEVCRKQGFTVLSIDISPERKPDVVCDICTSTFEDEFDVVVCSEVLEHIMEPHVAIEKILASLRNGGLLIMSTPFIFPLHDRPNDYFRYTKYGLEYLLRHFTNVYIQERNGWAESLCVLLSRFLLESKGRRRFFTAVIVLISIILYPMGTLVSHIWKSDFMTTGYIVTANKP
jgi:2-polyprenyl-3-methyl-5-hydroxy-6-metoxy-1,4-benzoquinol methylase